MTQYLSLVERINQEYGSLTKNSRRIADALRFNPEKVLILSTGEIADACNVSKTTVSRFIRQLGYQDHLALRKELLEERERGTPLLTTEVNDPGIQHDIKAIEQLWSHLVSKDMQGLIEALSRAHCVKVIGYRNSYPLALHFRQQLLQCRPRVELLPLPGQTVGEELASINDHDFIVLFGIRRRIRNFANIVDFLSDKRCLLVTDQSGLKYAEKINDVIVCQMNNEAPLDNYAAPMSLISYLVNKVFRCLGSVALNQSGLISQGYGQLHEIE